MAARSRHADRSVYLAGAKNCVRAPVRNGAELTERSPENGYVRSRSTTSERPRTSATAPEPIAWNQKLREPTRTV